MFKRTILIPGIISGLILGLWIVLAFSNIDKNKPNMGSSEIVGFSFMIIGLGSGMIFSLIRYTKTNGVLKIGKGILLCLGVLLITGIIYTIVWALVYKFIFPDFKEWYLNCQQQKVNEGKLSLSELQNTQKMMSHYDNPLIFTGLTMVELTPVGIPLALIIPPVYRWIVNRKKAG